VDPSKVTGGGADAVGAAVAAIMAEAKKRELAVTGPDDGLTLFTIPHRSDFATASMTSRSNR
jgi:hypothetical protein